MNIFTEMLDFTVDERVNYAKESSTYEVLAELANDDEPMVRGAVAKNEYGITTDILAKLAKDECWLVRLNVVYNLKTTPSILNQLSFDSNYAVREAVKLRRETGLF